MEREKKRMIGGIVDGQREKIAELKKELKITEAGNYALSILVDRRDAEIAEFRVDLRKRAEEIAELQVDYVVKDDEAGELDADLEVCKAKLADKRAETREIHHRVNNHFTIVAGTLSLQARKTENNEAKGALQEASNRIFAMAGLYKELLESDGQQVNMAGLVIDVFGIYDGANRNVKMILDVPADMYLPSKTALPCAQIVNELVSNALKHAFKNGRKGEVTVAMKAVKGKMSLGFSMNGKLRENDKVELVVSDNGVGFPEDFSFSDSKSFGMQIVESLVGQLDGEMEVDDSEGVKFIIRFLI